MLPRYDLAIISYNKALKTYQNLGEYENAKSVHSSIIDCYNALIADGLEADFAPFVKKQPTRISFRVGVVLQESNDSTWVLIDGGSNDGLFQGAKGQALGVYDEEYKDRGNNLLGKAEVIEVNPNFSHILVTIANLDDPEGKVYAGDVIQLPAFVPTVEEPSIFYELAVLNIDFLDWYAEPLYHPRHLFNFDSFELEEMMLQVMKSDIDSTAAWIRSEAPEDPRYYTILEEGRFKGLNMVEAMEQSDNSDIKAFLEFVESFPGKYMGHSWKINETYATWIINNSPIGSREMKRMLLSAESDEVFKTIFLEYSDDFMKGDFFNDWDMESDELADKGKFEEARIINQLLFRIAELIDSNSLRGWSHFDNANILEEEQKYPEAIVELKVAKELFAEAENIRGESFCANNTAHMYTNLGEYEKALTAYEDSYLLKLERLQSDSSDNVRVSTGRSMEGKGFSYYKMGEFPEALIAFRKALEYYQSARTLEGIQSTADIMGWLGESMKSMANYDSSLYYYELQHQLQIDLGNQSGQADALDNMAYAWSQKGDERKANELYYTSYELKVGLDDKNGAGFSMSNVAQTYWTLGEYDKAIESHSKAIALREEANNRKGQAYSWKKLGSLYLANSDPIMAMNAFKKAIDLYG